MLAQLTPSAAPGAADADPRNMRPRKGVQAPDTWGGAVQTETGAS